MKKTTKHCEIVYQIFKRDVWYFLTVSSWYIECAWLTEKMLDLECWSITLKEKEDYRIIPTNKIKFIRYKVWERSVIIKWNLNKIFDPKIWAVVDISCRKQPKTTISIERKKKWLRNKWPNK